MNFRLLFAALALAAGSLVFGSSAHAQDADEIFERLKEKYRSIESLRAEFSQTMTSSFTDDEATSTGLLIASGEQYRVEMEEQTLVTDGDVTWVYMPSQKQVLINDYSADEQTFSVNEFLFNYDEKFDLSNVETSTLNGERHYILALEPKSKDAFFTEATLSMRARDNVITRLRVVDVNGTTMVFDLTNIQLNPALEADVFSFIPPKGTEVIDLRS